MDALSFLLNISWVSLICFLVGFILVVIEMHMPGFGAAGISGSILLLLGIIFSVNNLVEALILIIIILAMLGMALTIVLQSAAKGKLSKSLVLNESLNKEAGYIGTEDLEYFLGKEGVSITVLRPAGTVDIEGIKIDVVTEGEFIQKGTKVRIIKVQGRRIVVKEADIK